MTRWFWVLWLGWLIVGCAGDPFITGQVTLEGAAGGAAGSAGSEGVAGSVRGAAGSASAPGRGVLQVERAPVVAGGLPVSAGGLLVEAGLGQVDGDAGATDAGNRDGAAEAAVAPLYGDASPPVEGARFGFALDEQGYPVVFDTLTGQVLARQWLKIDIVDLVWDAASAILVLVQEEHLVNGFRLHGLTFVGGQLSYERISAIGEDQRAFPTAGAPIRVTGSGSWAVLDERWQGVMPGAKLWVPAGAGPAGAGLIALATQAEEDVVFRAELAEDGWRIAQHRYPAPGRPSSRLLIYDGRAYVLRKAVLQGAVERADFPVGQLPSALSFSVVQAGLGRGTLEGVAFEAVQRALLAVVALEPAGGAELLVAASAGDVGHRVALPGTIEHSGWPAHQLVAHGGRAWVATSSGVHAFEAAGSHASPALAPLPGFDGSRLRGPLALLR